MGKVFPMRHSRPIKPPDPAEEARALAELKEREELKAKRAEEKRIIAKLRAEELARRAEKMPAPTPIEKPQPVPDDWYTQIPRSMMESWPRAKIVRFLLRNFQERPIMNNPELAEKLMEAAEDNKAIKKFQAALGDNIYNWAQTHNVEMDEDTAAMHAAQTVKRLLLGMHDNTYYNAYVPDHYNKDGTLKPYIRR